MRQVPRYLVMDIDDTVCDFIGATTAALNEHFGVAHSPSPDYQIHECYGLSGSDFLSLLVELNVYHQIKPYPGVVRALNVLKCRGWTPYWITARGSVRRGHDITCRWMKDHGIPAGVLHAISMEENKADYMPDAAHVHAVFEDRHHHLVNMTADRTKRWLVNQTWNAGPAHADGYTRIESYEVAYTLLRVAELHEININLKRPLYELNSISASGSCHIS